MPELSETVVSLIAAAAGLLLYALAWSSVGGLPAWLKWTLRLVLVGVVLVPFALLSTLSMQKAARAPMESAPTASRPAPSAEATRDADARRSSEQARSAAEEQERQRRAEVAEVERQAAEAKARVERQLAEAERKLKDMSADQVAEAQKKAAEAANGAGGAGPRYYKFEQPKPSAPEPTGGSGPAAPESSPPAGGAAPADTETHNFEANGRGGVPPKSASPGTTRGLDGFTRPRDAAPGGDFGSLGMSGTGTGGGGSGTRGFGQPPAARAPAAAPPPPPSAVAEAPDAATAPPPPPPPPPAASAPVVAPPAPAPAPITAAPRPAAPITTAPAPAPAAGAGEDKTDWTVVPVFFGTDREKVANDKRVEYGSTRARKLDLGRALVTVPKQHEVPQVERPWAITIPYFNYKVYEQAEDPKKHFTLQEIKNLTEAEMIDLVKQRLATSARFKDHAFVFIHGYNTTFDNAVYRAAQVAYDIKFDGAPFVYSWPSGGGIGSYTYDRESAAQAEPFLEDFLKLVTQKTGAKSVSLIAHSMGNQLLLRVLQDLQRSKPEGVQISQIILAAPDVDRDGFENIASRLKDMASGGITLYASANDRALNVSRRFNGGVPRAGDVPGGVPLVVPGVDTIDATAVSMDSLGLHHSGYAESNALLTDIGALIETGQRPPEKRVPALKRIDTSKGPFWRYP